MNSTELEIKEQVQNTCLDASIDIFNLREDIWYDIHDSLTNLNEHENITLTIKES